MTDDLEEVVARHPLLVGLADTAAAMVADCARRAAFDQGDLLLVEGGVADTLFLVDGGRVAIEIQGPAEGRLIIDTVGPGGVVGLSWVAPPFRWQFDARAAEASSAVAVDVEALRARLVERPEVGYPLLERLSWVLLGTLQATRIRLLDLYGDDRPR